MARATKLRVVGGKAAAHVAPPRPPKHGLEIGAPCPNCGTTLAGPWCYACGQKGEDYHRSIWLLVAEAFEGLTHLDGRLWTTLPRLLVRPGMLTRDYLDGHRASQLPPFRMFLVVLILVFFAGSLNLRHDPIQFNVKPADVQLDPAMRQAVGQSPTSQWLTEKAQHALTEPEGLLNAMEHWSHDFAILMLPIAALLLSLLFVFQRGVYVFDHLVFSMHSLAFQGLLLTAVFAGTMALSGAAWLLVLAPVHLFVHMRGTYRTSVVGTLARMALLFVGSATAFTFLMLGLVFIGVVKAH